MPVNYKLYPLNWFSEIRPAIMRRAGDRPERGIRASCEKCGVRNHSIRPTLYPDGMRDIKIVLTIAHLDQDVDNNEPENLAALCQRCHLRWDRPWSLINAGLTRDRKKRQGLLKGIDPNEWRIDVAKSKNKHSFNILLDDEEVSMLSWMAADDTTNMSIVLRQALRWRFAMSKNKVATCANGQACFVPNMHNPQGAPQPPALGTAIPAETPKQ